jgi:hypothetical protein
MKLCFTPWLTDPDPPIRMTDEQIEAMAERCFQYMKERHGAVALAKPPPDRRR